MKTLLMVFICLITVQTINAQDIIDKQFGNWELLSVDQTRDINTKLSVLDSLNYLILFRGELSLSDIKVTNDGGSTWELIYRVNSEYPFHNSGIWDIQYVSKDLIIAVGDSGSILRSSDNGSSWNRFSTNEAGPLQHVCFYDEQNGLVARTEDYSLLKTTDAGNTWNKISTPLIDETLVIIRQIHYTESEIIIVAVLNNSVPVIYNSIDDGLTWDRKIIYDIDFKGTLTSEARIINRDLILFKSPTYSESSNTFYNQIYRITDGGLNTELIMSPGSTMFAFSVVDESTYFIAGHINSLFYTNNSGNQWYRATDEFEYELGRIAAIEPIGDNKYIIVAGSYVFKLTIDITSVNDSYEVSNVLVFPNPLTNSLNILTESDITPRSIKIINLKGEIVLDAHYSASIPINSSIPSGTYFLLLEYDDFNSYHKFIKE